MGGKRSSSSTDFSPMEEVQYYIREKKKVKKGEAEYYFCENKKLSQGNDDQPGSIERKKEKKERDQDRKKERGRNDAQKQELPLEDTDFFSLSEVSSSTTLQEAAAGNNESSRTLPEAARNANQLVVHKREKADSHQDKTKSESKTKQGDSSSLVATEGVLRLPRKFKVEADETVIRCPGCSKDQRVVSYNFVIQGVCGFCAYCGESRRVEFI